MKGDSTGAEPRTPDSKYLSQQSFIWQGRPWQTWMIIGPEFPCPPPPPLTVDGQAITIVQSYKYLGVQIDTQLRWNEQVQRVVVNTTKWLLQYRRLTRPSSRTSTRLMQQLYISVALPKITYGLDIWYTPPPPNQPNWQARLEILALQECYVSYRRFNR